VPDAFVTRFEKAKTAFRKAQGALTSYRDEQVEVERRKQAQAEVQRTVERIKEQRKDLPEDEVQGLLKDAVKGPTPNSPVSLRVIESRE
jgi:hypothetical protein